MTPFLERYAAGRARPGMDWFAPLSGWFLVEMMRLEDARPGILAFATRAPPLWRNAVATSLSAGIFHSPESFLLRANGEVGEESTDVQVADALMAMKATGILEAAYSEVPPGFPATLKKIGSSLLNTSDAYARLYALLTSEEPAHQARRRVLEKLDARLDDELMQVVEVLDLGILSPKTAMAVRTATEAHKTNTRLPILRNLTGATDEALRQSIEDAPHFRSSNWVRGWLSKADRLPHLGIPLDDDPGVVRITPATARTMGREWQNCLAGHATAMALGATAYFAIRDLGVIVVLMRMDQRQWLLTGVHGRSNQPVSAETLRGVKERLSRQGVVCLMPSGPPPELEAIAGVFHSVDDLDFGFEGMAQ